MKQASVELVCLSCPLAVCDETHQLCGYRKQKRAKGIEKRTLAGAKNLKRYNEIQSGITSLGFRKYDKRRKPDSTQRTLWRIYKKKEIQA